MNKSVFLLLLGLLLPPSPATAQGCGPQNPNCIVPTVTPANTGDNRAASTQFVQNALVGFAPGTGITGPGSSTLNGLPLWANAAGTGLKDGAGQTIPGNYTWSGIQTFGPLNVFVRSANTTPVTVSTGDYFLCLDSTTTPLQVNLPATPATGLTFLMKDCTGHSATNAITLTPASGLIDGLPSFVMSTNFQSIAITFTGARWSVN